MTRRRPPLAERFMPDELGRSVDEVAAVAGHVRDHSEYGTGDLYTHGVGRACDWLARTAGAGPPLTKPNRDAPPQRWLVLKEIHAGQRILEHAQWRPETPEELLRDAPKFADVIRTDDPVEVVQGVVDMLTWAMSADPGDEPPIQAPTPPPGEEALTFLPNALARPQQQVVDVIETAARMRKQRQQPDRSRGVLEAGLWAGQATYYAPLREFSHSRPTRTVIADQAERGLQIEDGREPLPDSSVALDHVRGVVDMLTWMISNDTADIPLWPDDQPGPAFVFQPGTLARPAADIAACHAAAVANQQGSPGDEYHAGVVWACEWLGGVRGRCLPGMQPRPATPEAVAAELELARAAWQHRTTVPTLSRSLVRGAGATLRYATDLDTGPPVAL